MALAAPHGYGKSTLAGIWRGADKNYSPTTYSRYNGSKTGSWDAVAFRGTNCETIVLRARRLRCTGRANALHQYQIPRHADLATTASRRVSTCCCLCPESAKSPSSDRGDAAARLRGRRRSAEEHRSSETLVGERAVQAIDAAASIAGTVPLRRLTYYRGFEELGSIRNSVLRDVDELVDGR